MDKILVLFLIVSTFVPIAYQLDFENKYDINPLRMDLVLVLDTIKRGFVKKSDFVDAKINLIDFISELDIDDDSVNLAVLAITNDSVRVMQTLTGSKSHVSSVEKKLSNLRMANFDRNAMESMITQGLLVAGGLLKMNELNNRTDVQKVIGVITSGSFNNWEEFKVRKEANSLKKYNLIFTIGLGHKFEKSSLRNLLRIASSPEYFIDFGNLNKLLDRISSWSYNASS